MVATPEALSETDLTVGVVAEFELSGEHFEAVRVHQPGKEYVLIKIEKAIRAADTNNRVVRTDEQYKHVYEHRGNLPGTLNNYRLVTACPTHNGPRHVCSLFQYKQEWVMDAWDKSWDSLDGRLDDDTLVLRRRA